MKKNIIKKQKFVKQTKTCFKCNKPIDELNDNFLKLVSYNDGEIIEEVRFHLPKCWGDYNSDRVNSQLAQMSKVGFGILKNMGIQ